MFVDQIEVKVQDNGFVVELTWNLGDATEEKHWLSDSGTRIPTVNKEPVIIDSLQKANEILDLAERVEKQSKMDRELIVIRAIGVVHFEEFMKFPSVA